MKEVIELANKIDDKDFDKKDYKEKQKIIKARSKIGKWFYHSKGTYIKAKKETRDFTPIQNYLRD